MGHYNFVFVIHCRFKIDSIGHATQSLNQFTAKLSFCGLVAIFDCHKNWLKNFILRRFTNQVPFPLKIYSKWYFIVFSICFVQAVSVRFYFIRKCMRKICIISIVNSYNFNKKSVFDSTKFLRLLQKTDLKELQQINWKLKFVYTLILVLIEYC